MRCPACTTTVDDFKTLLIPANARLANDASAGQPTQRTKSEKNAAVAPVVEDDGKPVLLRFDNASWVRFTLPRDKGRPQCR